MRSATKFLLFWACWVFLLGGLAAKGWAVPPIVSGDLVVQAKDIVLADGSSDYDLAANATIFVRTPDGVCFAEPPTATVSGLTLKDLDGDPTSAMTAELADSDGDGCMDKASWTVYADDDPAASTDPDTITVTDVKVVVKPGYAVADTSFACFGTINCDLIFPEYQLGSAVVLATYADPIVAVAEGVTIPSVLSGGGRALFLLGSDAGFVPGPVLIGLPRGLVGAEVRIALPPCASFEDAGLTTTLLSSNPSYSGVFGVLPDGSLGAVVDTADVDTQVAIGGIRVVTDECPEGDLWASLSIDGAFSGGFHVATVVSQPTQVTAVCDGGACTPDNLPVIVRGVAAQTSVNLVVEELLPNAFDDLDEFVLVVPEGVVLDCNKSGNENVQVRSTSPGEVQVLAVDVNDDNVDNDDVWSHESLTIWCDVTAPSDYANDTVPVAVSVVDVDSDGDSQVLRMTEETVTAARVASPVVTITGSGAMARPNGRGVTTATIVEGSAGALKGGGPITAIFPAEVQVIEATGFVNEGCDLVLTDGDTGEDGFQATCSGNTCIWYVTRASTAPCALTLTIDFRVLEGEVGDSYDFSLSVLLASDEVYAETLPLVTLADTVSFSVTTGNVSSTDPALQALGEIAIRELNPQAVRDGLFRVAVHGVSYAVLDAGSSRVEMVDQAGMADGVVLLLTPQGLDPAAEDTMAVSLKGIVTTTGPVKVEVLDGGFSDDNVTGVGRFGPEVLALTDCSAEAFAGCDEEECGVVGGRWYGGACHEEEARPDLTVVHGSVTGEVEVGGTVSLSATVSNVGYAEAGSFAVTVYLSDDGALDASDHVVGTASVAELAANASLSVNIEALIPSGVEPGSYYLLVTADPNDAVVEADETNNVLAVDVQVAAACTPEHLEACDTQEDCESRGGYWYDGSCHDVPVNEPRWRIECVNDYDRAHVYVTVEDCGGYCGRSVNVLILARSGENPSITFSWAPGLSWVEGMHRFAYTLVAFPWVDLLADVYVPIEVVNGWDVYLVVDLDQDGVFDDYELSAVAHDVCAFDLCNKHRSLEECETNGCYWTGDYCVSVEAVD